MIYYYIKNINRSVSFINILVYFLQFDSIIVWRLKYKMNTMNRENGFTIVELIVTLVILGILVAAMVTRFVDLSSAADGAACKSNQIALEQAQRVYFIETLLQGNSGQYAGALDDLTSYIKGETIPDCPGGGQYHILPRGKITCNIGDHQR